MNKPGYGTEISTNPTNLLLVNAGVVRIPITVLTGQDLADGTVMGVQTSGGKAVAYDDDGTDDGRRVAKGILEGDCDTNTVAGDKQANMIIHGTFKDKDDLAGYDAAALADLYGKLIGDILTF